MSSNSKALHPYKSILERVTNRLDALDRLVGINGCESDEYMLTLVLIQKEVEARITRTRFEAPKFLSENIRNAVKAEVYEYHSSFFQSDYDIDQTLKSGLSLVGIENLSDTELIAEMKLNEEDNYEEEPSPLLQQAIAEFEVYKMLRSSNG